jgi:hypothetical protein
MKYSCETLHTGVYAKQGRFSSGTALSVTKLVDNTISSQN